MVKSNVSTNDCAVHINQTEITFVFVNTPLTRSPIEAALGYACHNKTHPQVNVIMVILGSRLILGLMIPKGHRTNSNYYRISTVKTKIRMRTPYLDFKKAAKITIRQCQNFKK